MCLKVASKSEAVVLITPQGQVFPPIQKLWEQTVPAEEAVLLSHESPSVVAARPSWRPSKAPKDR